MCTRVIACLLAFLTLLVTAPFSPAESVAGVPLGSMVAPDRATVGALSAPTGTTIFAGDRVVTNETPALINFSSGGGVELTRAAASFTRDGQVLVIAATNGLLRFNFKRGEAVKIEAGHYRFTSAGNGTAHIGELGLNQSGQIAMSLREGVFSAVDLSKGERSEVTPDTPLVALDITGRGNLTKAGKTVTDTTKTWKVDEHKGKCVEVDGVEYEIESNAATTLTIKGVWKANTATWDYTIKDCVKVAAAKPPDHRRLIAALIAGGGVGTGILIYEKKVKSKNTR